MDEISLLTLQAAKKYTDEHGGGGGGTDDYNNLKNQPKINNNTLVGNKNASDLGLVAAENGKGLSTNDYTDADKAIVGGVTAALAGKQDALSAGSHIAIDDDTISVNRWAVPEGKVVYTVITSDENYGQNVHVQRHTVDGGFIDDRVYTVGTWQTATVDDFIYIEDRYAKFYITLLKDSDEQSAGYNYIVNPNTTPTSNSFTFTLPQEENDNDLIIRSELDAEVNAIKDGQSIDSFADVETALATKADLTDLAPAFSSSTAYTVGQYVSYDGNIYKCTSAHSAGAWAAGDFTLVAVGSELESKQNATDNSLQTTDKTVVGAVNELKSGLTNYEATTNATLDQPQNAGKNLVPMSLNNIKAINTDGTWNNNTYTYNGVDFTVNETDGKVTSITVNGTCDSSVWATWIDLATSIKTTAGKGYILTGCPAGGGSGQYALYIDDDGTNKMDYGNGINITAYGTSFTFVRILVYRDKSVDNITFYPMLRYSYITDPTFAPYIPSVESRIEAVESGLINQTARSRSNITSRLTNLATAVAEQNLEKYGYKIGDYFTGASGYTYHLADMDTFYGGYNNNAIVNTHHISLVVKTGANSKWAEENDTSGGYKTSTLHNYLSSTVLDNIKSDMISLFGGSTGLEHLVSHKLLWTTATSGAWAWSDNAEYISALSEPQVYGTNVWAIDGYQTGEAWKWLEIFHKFNFCEIIGNIWWWLRSVSSASGACVACYFGNANDRSASSSAGAVGLIIFH